ncbi:MAG: aminopeptidase P family protein [Armatimonadetes bacterium]|nr:aminopeptidase P family protein [Armatimonadota bacterium]
MQTSRLERLRLRLVEKEVEGLLLTQLDNIGYISGFTGSTAVALVTERAALFFVDSRYEVQAQAQCPEFEVRKVSDGLLVTAAKSAQEMGVRTLGFEQDYVTVRQHTDLGNECPDLTLMGLSGMVEDMRQVKDAGEIDLIRTACKIVDDTFAFILPRIKPGVRERDLALELDWRMRRLGAEKEGFDTIIASGCRSAMPHGKASEKIIEAGDFVTLDFGPRRQGYHADLTRTVVVGKATDEQRKVYHTVLEAQLKAIDALRPGVAGKAVDEVARNHIKGAGYGDYFGHGLGHGLGRAVHDGPTNSPKSEAILQAGVVTTIEPGIYIPDWGGVRIEDDCLITETGCEVLTHSPKELIEV